MRRIRVFFIVAFVSIFASCTNNEIGNSKDVNPQAIYFDYRVWGTEEAGYMTVRLQYKFGGPNGTSLVLTGQSRAELDGVALRADSSKMNGAYYEATKPIREFTGTHSIVFTDKNGKQYKEEFKFQPISLRTAVPLVIKRSDLTFELDGVGPKDNVKVLLNDTASFSEGIDRVDTVRNRLIVVTRTDLRKLVNGPISLQLSREEEKWIKNGTEEGGKLYISYELKRQFKLED